MSKAHLIETLRQYPAIVKEFLQSIPEARVHARLGEGFWTIYEHLEHLVLTQEVIHQRLQLVRDQERPQIVPFNPDEHHKEVPAGARVRSVSHLVEQYTGWREKQLAIIEEASPELWGKSATHPEYERYGFEILVRHTLLHDGFHLSRIEDLALMKPHLLIRWPS